ASTAHGDGIDPGSGAAGRRPCGPRGRRVGGFDGGAPPHPHAHDARRRPNAEPTAVALARDQGICARGGRDARRVYHGLARGAVPLDQDGGGHGHTRRRRAMKRTSWSAAFVTATAAATLGLGLVPVLAQHAGHPAPATPPAAAKPPTPITMEELHRGGGVPPGWKFTLPPGDAKTGRQIFAKLECNKCHEVKPDFPKSGGAGDIGPELTGMGAHHPAEYFAQSIVDPNAVILP